jgi:hypothetical protein
MEVLQETETVNQTATKYELHPQMAI